MLSRSTTTTSTTTTTSEQQQGARDFSRAPEGFGMSASCCKCHVQERREAPMWSDYTFEKRGAGWAWEEDQSPDVNWQP